MAPHELKYGCMHTPRTNAELSSTLGWKGSRTTPSCGAAGWDCGTAAVRRTRSLSGTTSSTVRQSALRGNQPLRQRAPHEWLGAVLRGEVGARREGGDRPGDWRPERRRPRPTRHVGPRKLDRRRRDALTSSRKETCPKRTGTPLSSQREKGVSRACRLRLYSASDVDIGPVALPIAALHQIRPHPTDGVLTCGQRSAVGSRTTAGLTHPSPP